MAELDPLYKSIDAVAGTELEIVATETRGEGILSTRLSVSTNEKSGIEISLDAEDIYQIIL